MLLLFKIEVCIEFSWMTGFLTANSGYLYVCVWVKFLIRIPSQNNIFFILANTLKILVVMVPSWILQFLGLDLGGQNSHSQKKVLWHLVTTLATWNNFTTWSLLFKDFIVYFGRSLLFIFMPPWTTELILAS